MSPENERSSNLQQTHAPSLGASHGQNTLHPIQQPAQHQLYIQQHVEDTAHGWRNWRCSDSNFEPASQPYSKHVQQRVSSTNSWWAWSTWISNNFFTQVQLPSSCPACEQHKSSSKPRTSLLHSTFTRPNGSSVHQHSKQHPALQRLSRFQNSSRASSWICSSSPLKEKCNPWVQKRCVLEQITRDSPTSRIQQHGLHVHTSSTSQVQQLDEEDLYLPTEAAIGHYSYWGQNFFGEEKNKEAAHFFLLEAKEMNGDAK